jgi:RNA polymerase sigma-70 factor (ECF subfamily)
VKGALLLIRSSSYARDMSLRDRVLSGERSAAEALLAEHLDPLFQFVHWRLGGDEQGVEDLVQDTFLVALQRIDGFDGRSSLHTWLCGIAKNKIRDARRTRKPRSLQEAIEEADPEIDAILAEVAREPLPEHALERAETRDLVGATLSSLPPEYAEALVQKYVEGRSVAEIAKGRGKGDKAIESLLTRARSAFARVFELLAKKRGGLDG